MPEDTVREQASWCFGSVASVCDNDKLVCSGGSVSIDFSRLCFTRSDLLDFWVGEGRLGPTARGVAGPRPPSAFVCFYQSSRPRSSAGWPM